MPLKVAAKYTADRTIAGDLQKIRADLALVKGRIFSRCWGLREIKREVHRIECAVFNHDTGLAEIKTEVSAMAAAASATSLTSGPFRMITREEEIRFVAINYSNATQTVTFTVHELDYGLVPCLRGRILTISAGPCCFDTNSVDELSPGNKEILAQLSSRNGVHIYAETISVSPTTGDLIPAQRFYSSMWQPVGTMCLP